MYKKYYIQQSPFLVPTIDGKNIEEYFENISDGNSIISITRRNTTPHWNELFQIPAFDEYLYYNINAKKKNTSSAIKKLY